MEVTIRMGVNKGKRECLPHVADVDLAIIIGQLAELVALVILEETFEDHFVEERYLAFTVEDFVLELSFIH